MIKLKLTKNKIVSVIAMVSDVILSLHTERKQLTYSLKRAEIAAHLYTLEAFNKKLRMKSINVEEKFQNYNFTIAITEMEAYLFILYTEPYNFTSEQSFNLLTMKQISEPIFKHLLS